jgi:hypothetical protein
VYAPRLRLLAGEAGTCPEHGSKLRKAFVAEQLKPGLVDWPAVQARLREQDIVLVGGGADEAPEVYKRLPGGTRCARRHDSREAHPAPARRGDGRTRRRRSVQGLTKEAALESAASLR